MIIRSKAPLRIGLAGGGTDVSPYSDIYGGSVLNVTINRFVYCTIETCENQIILRSIDKGEEQEFSSTNFLEPDNLLRLHKGVYNRIVKDYNNGMPLPHKLITYSDVPPGSGLGSSSTLVVAMVQAYSEWLELSLGEYDIGFLSYIIEREDLNYSGGKQDHYAATFGGFNFMEFSNGQVIVNPLRLKNAIINELEYSMLLYFSGISRESEEIINDQIKNVNCGKEISIKAMHELKNNSLIMKEALLQGDLKIFTKCLGKTWNDKKKMANSITNSGIDKIMEEAINNGAKSGKVSGAGGGGFIIFIVDPIMKMGLMHKLNSLGGRVINFHFTDSGSVAWRV